ncbi:MAG: hypothetical protein ACRD5I_13265, partial [Candidatus Acidiferrales bacterium]
GKIAGGWQINGQVFLFSGRPWSPQSLSGMGNNRCTDDPSFNLSFSGVGGMSSTCRPLSADPNAPMHTIGAPGTPDVRWWRNPNSTGIPFAGTRNHGLGDATQLVNMGLFKNVRFGPEGRFNLQMRWTMVNAFNVRNFGTPASIFESSGNFGRPNRRDVNGRINRLALRLTF